MKNNINNNGKGNDSIDDLQLETGKMSKDMGDINGQDNTVQELPSNFKFKLIMLIIFFVFMVYFIYSLIRMLTK